MGGAGRLEVVCQNRDILFGEGASNKLRVKEVKKILVKVSPIFTLYGCYWTLYN